MNEVSTLYHHLCALHVNHLETVYTIYHYTKKNMKFNPGRVVFDPTYQDIDERLFEKQSKLMDQWRDFSPEVVNPLPHCIP